MKNCEYGWLLLEQLKFSTNASTLLEVEHGIKGKEETAPEGSKIIFLQMSVFNSLLMHFFRICLSMIKHSLKMIFFLTLTDFSNFEELL